MMNQIKFTHPHGFPWRQETLGFMQDSYGQLMQALVAHCGCTPDKVYLLQGIEVKGNALTPGWCVVKNEILPFEGGIGTALAVEETPEAVTYQDGIAREAYCLRKAVVRDSGTPISQCVRIPTEQAIEQLIHRNETPKGLIAMWSGSIGDIPKGWTLCDGKSGTPNLTDRFIVGAGKAYLTGNTGGKKEVTLTELQMPSHNHSGNTRNSGSHSHEYRDGYFIEGMKSGNDDIYGYGSEKVGENFYGNDKIDRDNQYIWYKNRNTQYAGNHTHSFTTYKTGGGQAHENRPPYYALAYIMYQGFK